MNHDDVQGWLDRYLAAWRANQREPIEALFTEDATYRWNPYAPEDRTVRGRSAITDAWLESTDEPDAWEASYAPYAVDGDRAVAIGTSRYLPAGDQPEKTYHNVFLLRFAPDGRCSEFVEYFMLAQ